MFLCFGLPFLSFFLCNLFSRFPVFISIYCLFVTGHVGVSLLVFVSFSLLFVCKERKFIPFHYLLYAYLVALILMNELKVIIFTFFLHCSTLKARVTIRIQNEISCLKDSEKGRIKIKKIK